MAPNTKDKWVRRFLITETTRHKKGFTVYKVTSVIYPKSAPEAVSRVSIWKRYNEFRKLHSELISRHDSLKIKEPFPPFPKPRFFGRFEAEVIEERRQCAIRLLEFIAKHTALFTSNVFVKFFESGHSCFANDCSLSLGSDTSEDDYNLNSALRGTNYTPTPVSQTENNQNCRNVEHSITDNQVSAEPTTAKQLPDYSSPDFSSKTDHSGLDLSQNNNYIEETNSGVGNLLQTNRTEPLEDENQSRTSNGTFSAPDRINFQKSSSFLVNDGSDLPHGAEEGLSSYILVAAAHMSAAFRHEAIGEFEEAFTQYKLGISELLDGVQSDPDLQRRVTVKEKISKYLERAEKLYNRHLNCNVSVLSKPADELRNYKVLRVVGSVMLVRDTERECNRVIKTVQKPAGSSESLSDYILRGKVPFMVRLYGCIETESTIFLVLQHASGGKLWEYMKSYHKGRNAVSNWCEKGHTRSASCEAIIQSEIRARDSPKVREISLEAKNEVYEALDLVENAQIDPEESLKRLEEEFGANSASGKTFPTTDLLAKSQELLRSVDATIKKSNSIASRLNESEGSLYSEKRRNLPKSDDIKSEIKAEVRESNRSESLSNLEEVSLRKGTFDIQEAARLGKGKLSFIQSNGKPSSSEERGSSECSNSFESQESQLSNEDKLEDSDSGLCRSKPSLKTNALHKSNDEILNSDRFQSLVAEDSGIEMDDELWKLPEGTIRFWAAEILATLESLHQQDVIVGDLKPDNILLGNGGHVAMSYIVPKRSLEFLQLKKPYSAPELCMFLPTVPPTTAADIWSYGVLLYELFTGIQFQSKHPGPFHSHSILNIPEELSSNVKSLISNVLRYKPEERLTIPEIKEHPFFANIDWTSLVNSCFT